jgi:hypothetical protein
MRPSCPRIATLALGLALALAMHAPARATTVVPVDDADLIDDAASILVARVAAIRSHWDPARRQIFTDVTLALDEVLAGPPLPPTVTIRQPGGRVGGLEAWIDGAPEFHVGERALLFLSVAPDGTLRVAHLHEGKFRVLVEPESGGESAVRVRGGQVRVLAPQRSGPPPRDTRSLDEFRRLIRGHAARRAARRFLGATAPAPPAGPVEQTDAFTFIGAPSRWFEPDAGRPVAMSVNASGEPRAPSRGFDQARAALAAWRDSASTFRFAEGPLTGAGGAVLDGVSSIAFGDPLGQMDPPVNCSGVLAQGGFFRSPSESRVVNGQTFWRVLEGDVVVADGWQGCGFYEVFANLTETVTHELGHVLGLGHSSDADATMYGIAHFDGRGSSLRADDRAGLRTIYPAPASLTVRLAGAGAGSVRSSPAGIACPGDCGEPFSAAATVTLTATPAAGSTFAGWSGGGCSGTGACTPALGAGTTVTAAFNASALGLRFAAPAAGATVSGRTTVSLAATGGAGYTFRVQLDGNPIFAGTASGFAWDTTTATNGTHTLSATVTDSRGRTASTSIPVAVSNAGGGALRVAITQPANGATVRGTAWAVLWVEGTTGASSTFTLTLAGRAMGTGTTSGRGPVSLAYDTRTVGDGAQTLTARVRGASGASGSSSVTVTVANGSGSPSTPAPAPTGGLRVFITRPGSGATVSGTAWVTLWLEGASSGSNTYTLSAAGSTVATTITASRGPVTLPWLTSGTPDGAQTLTATVRDAAGNTGRASIAVTVANGRAAATARPRRARPGPSPPGPRGAGRRRSPRP